MLFCAIPLKTLGFFLLVASLASARSAAYRNGVAFRESPPPLAVDRWLRRPIDPSRPNGEVTVIVFFAPSHPQTAKLLPRLHALHERLRGRGLRLAGVADAESRALRGLAFPVAIDRRRKSLARYHGSHLPWAVFLDRYGRVAWMGGLNPQAGTMARARRTLLALVAQPTYAELVRRKATAHLASIHTVDAVSALFALGAHGAETAAAHRLCGQRPRRRPHPLGEGEAPPPLLAYGASLRGEAADRSPLTACRALPHESDAPLRLARASLATAVGQRQAVSGQRFFFFFGRTA